MSTSSDKAKELETLIRVAGAQVVDEAVLVRPDELGAFDASTPEGIADLVHHLLWRVGLGDRRFTIADERVSQAASAQAITFGEVADDGLVVTLVELGSPLVTLDDLSATVADLRFETLLAHRFDAIEDVDCSTRAIAVGLGLLVVPLPAHADSDVTRDEWLDLLALWHRVRGEEADASLEAVTRADLSQRIAALPDRGRLRETLGMPATAPAPSPSRAVPRLDEAARAACLAARAP